MCHSVKNCVIIAIQQLAGKLERSWKVVKTYSELLKSLIDFTDTKLMVLANALGYDTSYISKWCSGNKLPTAKSIHEINEILGEIFAETIMEEETLVLFY